MPDVQFPFAMRDGIFTLIEEVQPGDVFSCVDDACGSEMIPKRGDIRAHHFAHKSESDERACYGEGWLRKAAKAAIQRGFEDALVTGSPYCARLNCSDCNAVVWEVDLVGAYEEVKLEAGDIARVRSDLRFDGGSGRPLIIEVVVSHPITTATFKKYEAEGVLLGQIHPQHDDLLGFTAGGVLLDALWFAETSCPPCEDKGKKLAAHRAIVEAQRETAKAEQMARKVKSEAASVASIRAERQQSAMLRHRLGEVKGEWLATWEARGRPLLELNQGEVIHDLSKYLSGGVSVTHQAKLTQLLS